jgi:hypothetical protein
VIGFATVELVVWDPDQVDAVLVSLEDDPRIVTVRRIDLEPDRDAAMTVRGADPYPGDGRQDVDDDGSGAW